MLWPGDKKNDFNFTSLYIIPVLNRNILKAAEQKASKLYDVNFSTRVFSSIFICYITGLICLTIGLDIINIIWYKLIYHMDPGTSINWFNGNFSFNLNFISNLTKENIGNFLMFLPFGILYPLSQKKFNYKNTIIKGIILVLIIREISIIVVKK